MKVKVLKFLLLSIMLIFSTSIAYAGVNENNTSVNEAAVESLIQNLTDQNLSVKVNAVKALVEIGEPAVEPLIQALEDDNPQVRASAAEALSGINDERIVEPLTKALNDEDELVRTFAKMGLERIENQQQTGVIATYGKEREFSIEDEKREWFDKLDEIGSGVRGDMQVYLYPDGPVISYGYEYQGYLTVSFLVDSDVDESLMDEIYGIFDQQGIQMEIDDIPMVFQFESLPVEDIEPLETPGFTAITLLIVFLGLLLKK